VSPGADAQRALRSFAEQGFNPIIAHSFNYRRRRQEGGRRLPEDDLRLRRRVR